MFGAIANYLTLSKIASKQHRAFLFCLCGDRNKASSRVRGYWIAAALTRNGEQCTLGHYPSKMALLRFCVAMLTHEIIVFQKVYSRWHCLCLRWANRLEKTTILDLDDAPSRVNHPVTLKNVEYMMCHVSAVTVGSQALFDYASQFSDHVHLIPSSITLEHYQPDQKVRAIALVQPAPVCLGWIGNGRHYKSDLIAMLKEPLTQLASEQAIRFKLIGACHEQSLYDAFGNIPGLELDFIDQLDWADPKAIAHALQDIDIGLYPLLPNDFNQYKCGFKALEYMAMKIPVVSSDVAENREIIQSGVDGLFARSPQEWTQQLSYLINDKPARLAMGERGREKIEQQYSIARAAESILQIV